MQRLLRHLPQQARLVIGHTALSLAFFVRTLSAQGDTTNAVREDMLSLTPIGELTAVDSNPPEEKLVRVRGSVETVERGSLLVRDPSGAITVEFTNKGAFHLGSAVEVVAWPAIRQKNIVLTRAVISAPAAAAPTLATLTKIAQVRDLSVPQAALGYPVRVKGVVTYEQPDVGLHFVQDDSAGIYIITTALGTKVLPGPGVRVEIWGFSGPGDFAPIINAERIRVLAGGQFPRPAPVSYQMLMTGAADSQWITLKGIVRSITTNGPVTTLNLSIGEAVIQTQVLDNSNTPPTNLLGAAIEAGGVCRTLFDERRRFKGLGFCVPGWPEVEIKEYGIADPFQLPVRSINELFEFNAEAYGVRRSHVTGRVILRQNDGTVFVQDRSGGVRVEAESGAPVDSWVEVAGFPAVKDQLPVLEDAIVRKLNNQGIPPMAMHLRPDEPLNEDFNATLVSLEGRAVGCVSRVGGDILTVEIGQRLIDAILEKSRSPSLTPILPGSTVRLTGVYVARMDNSHRIQSFQIFLRSPEDVVVTSVPPWWTAERTLWILGGLAVVLLVALAWVVALRKQVRRRTGQLRDKIEEHKQTEALLKEEIRERKHAEAQIEKAHRELMAISHQAGMAEVATSVLHNVGNVLNSVNISSSLVADKLRDFGVGKLVRVVDLLKSHAGKMGDFIDKDPKGKKLPAYLEQLAEHLCAEQDDMLRELKLLMGNIDHIKEIVAMQQNYARISGIRETVIVADLVEDAIRLNIESLERHRVQIRRDYGPVPSGETEKHKALQILVNLIQNAKNAMSESGQAEKELILRVEEAGPGRARVIITDNGQGIAPENLTRIFSHGFTTRKDGHGFGLHSGALAARQLGGLLTAHSKGFGKGATFTLELPVTTPKGRNSGIEASVAEAAPLAR